MKKAKLDKKIQKLNLSEEDKINILSINRNANILCEKANKFLDKEKEFFDGENLNSIFLYEFKNGKVLEKYKETLDGFKKEFNNLKINSKVQYPSTNFEDKKDADKIIDTIINSIENYDRLLIFDLKLKAIQAVEIIKSSDDDEKVVFYKNQLDDILLEMEKLIENNFVNIESISKDYEYLREFRNENKKVKYSLKNYLYFTAFSFLCLGFLAFAITATVIWW